MKLIDAEQMKQIVDEYIEETGVDVFTVYHIHDFLDECDAVDAQPVRHGRWEFVNLAKSYLEAPCGDTLRCSVCNFVVDVSEQTPYCPNCGCKMDGEA